MEVVVGKKAGFCAGVEFTVNKAEELLSQGEIYCLGEIVHNKQVVESLEEKGMKTVNSIEEIPDNSRVIFRAHGEPSSTYERATEKKLKVHDLTCPNVTLIHTKVKKAKADSFIIIIGVKNHPETIGTKGCSGESCFVIETEDDILDAYMEYEKTMLGKVFVVAQTTFSSKMFDKLAEKIENNFCEAEVVINKTICNSTENRQLEAMKMSKENDIMLIIGGKNSSNTRKLYEISTENCDKVFYIQTVADIEKMKFSRNDKIGIMAGASTPQSIIEEIRNYLLIERN